MNTQSGAPSPEYIQAAKKAALKTGYAALAGPGFKIIPIELIEVERRLRPLSEAKVESLSASIAEIGLLNPITVYARQIFRDGNYVDGFGLVAGAHRLESVRKLGLVSIAAQVVKLSDLRRQIAECDENLCGTNLTPSERAKFIKRRKDAYEALHPEAKAGAVRARAANEAMGHDVDANFAPTFAADTATKTGQSERTVQLDAERGAKVIPEVLDMIKGSKLDTGTYLDKIKSFSPNDQFHVAKRDLKDERRQDKEKAIRTGVVAVRKKERNARLKGLKVEQAAMRELATLILAKMLPEDRAEVIRLAEAAGETTLWSFWVVLSSMAPQPD